MMQAAPETPALALRYALRRDGRGEVEVAVPASSVHRFCLPDRDTKARFVTAVLDARCERDESLELLGEDVARLKPAGRSRLRRRVGVLTPAVGLISNLNAWENISLPAAYHGTPPLGQIAEAARDALAALGADPEWLLARLPDELDEFEKKLVKFTRLLVAAPELAIFDALGDDLDPGEHARAAGFEAEYLARKPAGTLIYVDLPESRP
jgi:predicted ABC-type transport system involved in lysophospholipase L1 biosynthesis ATPase subunit